MLLLRSLPERSHTHTHTHETEFGMSICLILPSKCDASSQTSLTRETQTGKFMPSWIPSRSEKTHRRRMHHNDSSNPAIALRYLQDLILTRWRREYVVRVLNAWCWRSCVGPIAVRPSNQLCGRHLGQPKCLRPMRICTPIVTFLCYRSLRSLHRNELVVRVATGTSLPKTSASKGDGRFLQVLRQGLLSVVVPVNNLSTQARASPQAEHC